LNTSEVKTVRTIEMKLKLNSIKTVLSQPKENARTAVKRFCCFAVSAVFAELLSIMHTSSPHPRLWFGAQTAATDSDWLKQLKRFTA